MADNYYFFQPKDYILVTPAATTPISVAEVKSYARISSTSQDTLIGILINAAVSYCESYTKRDLINKTYKFYLDTLPNYNANTSLLSNGFDYKYRDTGILVKKSKLQSVTSIKYYLDDVLTTWDSANYYKSNESIYSSIYLTQDASYPDNIDTKKQSVEITFVAGYGASASDVPDQIRLGLLAHVTYMLENRGDCGGGGETDIPLPIRSMYNQYRIINIGVC